MFGLDITIVAIFALAALSKSATPKRVRNNAVADHPVVLPAVRKKGAGK